MSVLAVLAALLFFGGFILYYSLLVEYGGLNKLNQLGVIADLALGRLGPGNQKRFFLALGLIVVGACSGLINVAATDAARRKQCVAECNDQGYADGEIGPSNASDPARRGRALFLACTCSGHPTSPPLELRADELVKE